MGQPQFMFVSPVMATGTADGWRARRPGTAPPFDQPAAPAAEPAGGVAWRLLGANNRELGRSLAVFADDRGCRAGIEAVRAGVGTAQQVLAQELGTGAWSWRLDLPDATLAGASRTYSRERECRYALSAFCAAVPVALLPGGAPPVLPGGAPGPVRVST